MNVGKPPSLESSLEVVLLSWGGYHEFSCTIVIGISLYSIAKVCAIVMQTANLNH